MFVVYSFQAYYCLSFFLYYFFEYKVLVFLKIFFLFHNKTLFLYNSFFIMLIYLLEIPKNLNSFGYYMLKIYSSVQMGKNLVIKNK